MCILEWGEQPKYYSWTSQPTFRTVKLSELIDNGPTIIKPKQHLRVTLDIDISYEEASFIKETYLADYAIRELTLIPEKRDVELSSDTDVKAFESVDQIVTNQLISVESDTYDVNLLLDIYNNL